MERGIESFRRHGLKYSPSNIDAFTGMWVYDTGMEDGYKLEPGGKRKESPELPSAMHGGVGSSPPASWNSKNILSDRLDGEVRHFRRSSSKPHLHSHESPDESTFYF